MVECVRAVEERVRNPRVVPPALGVGTLAWHFRRQEIQREAREQSERASTAGDQGGRSSGSHFSRVLRESHFRRNER